MNSHLILSAILALAVCASQASPTPPSSGGQCSFRETFEGLPNGQQTGLPVGGSSIGAFNEIVFNGIQPIAPILTGSVAGWGKKFAIYTNGKPKIQRVGGVSFSMGGFEFGCGKGAAAANAYIGCKITLTATYANGGFADPVVCSFTPDFLIGVPNVTPPNKPALCKTPGFVDVQEITFDSIDSIGGGLSGTVLNVGLDNMDFTLPGLSVCPKPPPN